MKGISILYTEDELAFIKSNSHLPRQSLSDLFNAKFDRDVSMNNIRALCNRKGWKAANNGQFKSGNTPHNKGKTVPCYSPDTCFKPGEMPSNHRPVGSERVNKDGYIEIKVADPKRWMTKHRHIWEQHHGAVPNGHIVIFMDGNNRNFSPDNLELISRAVNGKMSKEQAHSLPARLKDTMINVIRIDLKAKQIKNNATT